MQEHQSQRCNDKSRGRSDLIGGFEYGGGQVRNAASLRKLEREEIDSPPDLPEGMQHC